MFKQTLPSRTVSKHSGDQRLRKETQRSERLPNRSSAFALWNGPKGGSSRGGFLLSDLSGGSIWTWQERPTKSKTKQLRDLPPDEVQARRGRMCRRPVADVCGGGNEGNLPAPKNEPVKGMDNRRFPAKLTDSVFRKLRVKLGGRKQPWAEHRAVSYDVL